MKSRLTQGLFVVGACLLMSPLLLYSKLQWQRPSRTNLAAPLFAGITYQREVYETPWPYIVHIVSIDLTAAGLRVKVSSDDAIAEGSRDDNFETTAHTTSDFLVANSLQLAVNASYFYPFQEKTPWNFYPHPGDRVNVVGEAIANGERYSDPKAHWPALCFGAGNQAQVAPDGTCPDGTLEAIAGSEVLLHHGKPIPLATKPDFPYARVAAAIDASGEHLWLIVVDGKQP
ncbi:MAG: phosphodiester glycosidase family protein, partial [Cyanobacteria bacterium P01_F01_bin.86]